MARQRRKFDEEFKRDAVRLMRSRGTRTITQVAADLGVGPNQLHKWAEQFDKFDFSKRNDKGETLEEENRRLRKENERLQLEKTILKRQYFPKGTDLSRHSAADLAAVAAALNSRPRKTLEWRTPGEVFSDLLLSARSCVLRRPFEPSQYASVAFRSCSSASACSRA